MPSDLVQLLGEKLLSDAGEVATAGALDGKAAVALYFSAHWCPPCRGFTPKLAEWYTSSLKAKGLEVVFVSSDKDEDAFRSYFGEMPWKALPFSDRARKEELSKKYKVSGIPSVVILDGEGKVITKDGRTAIANDPEGEDFPWKPKSLNEILASATLIGKDEHPIDGGSLAGKVFALYFSAHWCPPCRGFTPQLAEWYTTSLKDKGLEIVFVSSDRDEDSFKEYFADQPWLALAYSCRKEKEQLSNLFGVRGIPSLVIVDKDGSTITKDGRAAVSSDPTGSEFPWYPKPVTNLSAGPGHLNESAVVVSLCEAANAQAQEAAEKAMAPIAQKYIDDAKTKGEEEPEIAFMIATSAGDIAGKLRSMTSLPALPSEDGVEAPPRLILMNIPDDGGYYTGPEGDITQEIVEGFVADFLAGKLERQQLS